MLWTSEAIGVLKKLAREGRSASVIAAELGAASRNAVIGKANRIGIKLQGGGRVLAPETSTRAYPAPITAIPRQEPVSGKRSRAPSGELQGKAAWTPAAVLEMRPVRLEEILEIACRWPLGDPRNGEFAYCGLESAKGHSYCAGHYRMAYQPPKARTRQTPHVRRSIPYFSESS